MIRVRWSDPSLEDLRRINAWLMREANPDFAIRTLAAIRYRAKFLVDFPRGGRPSGDDTRTLRVLTTPYLIRYRIHGDLEVEVLRVHHERQNWQLEAL